jgi:DNA ligase-associated metallophosphoesterase
MTERPPGSISIMIGDAELQLLPDRAVHWVNASTLLVADPHFGKAATFRAAGIFVPSGTTAATLSRLDALLDATGARRIVFLGDFLHAREGRHPSTLASIDSWRARHASVEMLLVRGNHDRRAGDPPPSLEIACVDGPRIEGPFALAHHPVHVNGAYVLAGHLHPTARLRGAAREHARLPCFWFGAECAVLPAFGEFTGVSDVHASAGDRLWVTTGEEVIALAALDALRRA